MHKIIRCSVCARELIEISTSFGDRVDIDEKTVDIYCGNCKNKKANNASKISFEDCGKMYEICEKRLKEGADCSGLLREVMTEYLHISNDELNKLL